MKRSLVIKLVIIFLFVLLYCICFLFGAKFYVDNRLDAEKAVLRGEMDAKDVPEGTIDKYLANIPAKTNIAVYGVDKNEALADVIFVVNFDKNEGSVHVISIPRDTFVVMPKQRRDILSKNGLWAPADGMKINELHSYAGKKYGNDFLTMQIEEMLGIKIDYYVEVNLNAFIEIVDAVGGVEIDAKYPMYYVDPTQDLYINIKPGLQLMDGQTAQGFVRYRQLVRGDIDRIENQKIFLSELAKQVLNKETIMNNLVEFVGIVIKNVKTNIPLSEAVKYASFVEKIDLDKMIFETLPGDGRTPYNYYPDETREIVNRLFYSIGLESETGEEASDEDLSEEVTQ